MLTVLYLAKIADLVQTDQETLLGDFSDTDALLTFLRSRNAIWNEALNTKNVYKLAINNVIIHQSHALNDGDVIAILPPVTGG